MPELPTLDSLLPPAVATKAEIVAVQKTHLDALSIFLLAILAGAFIALGGMFSTAAVTGASPVLGYGLTRLLGGLAFCLGLILVVVGGAELFTGNNLLIIPVAGRRLLMRHLAQNWLLVYFGNFVGALLTAYLVYLAQWYAAGNGAVGEMALKIANTKCGLEPIPAIVRGIYCNALVCLAVWLTYSCRTTGDKIMAILFPITAFVALEMEHCVANMYFIPFALFVKTGTVGTAWAQGLPAYEHLTWGQFLWGNLLPVTIGNVIGGSGFVGGMYWLVYLRPSRHPPEGPPQLDPPPKT
jgi:formate/nitrite transporter